MFVKNVTLYQFIQQVTLMYSNINITTELPNSPKIAFEFTY